MRVTVLLIITGLRLVKWASGQYVLQFLAVLQLNSCLQLIPVNI